MYDVMFTMRVGRDELKRWHALGEHLKDSNGRPRTTSEIIRLGMDDLVVKYLPIEDDK